MKKGETMEDTDHPVYINAGEYIKELWICTTSGASGESLPTMLIGGMRVPLMAVDREGVEALHMAAQKAADISQQIVTLSRFTMREEMVTFTPNGTC
jgi:hypothetical protein